MNQTDPETGPAYLILDPKLLQEETLNNMAREFILREQAQDYSPAINIEHQIASAVRRMYSGELLLTFDPENESVGIMPKEHFKQSQVNISAT